MTGPANPSYRVLSERVEVIAVFEEGRLNPIRFRWNGQSYRIARITGRWKSPKGDQAIRHFAVVDTSDNVFQLSYDERLTQWTLSKVWVE